MTLEITKLTDWKSEPSLKDLKEDDIFKAVPLQIFLKYVKYHN